jgi:hypothetical protein
VPFRQIFVPTENISEVNYYLQYIGKSKTQNSCLGGEEIAALATGCKDRRFKHS